MPTDLVKEPGADGCCFTETQRMLRSWYGGADLKGMISRFSPHALTRLALQTGGI